MRFKAAVSNVPALGNAFRPGLQAIRNADAQHIQCDTPRILAGSVNIDAALSETLPTAPRWDYAIGIQQDRDTDAVVWIEMHPASSTSNVNEVLSKLKWLQDWATEAAPSLACLTREYVWVATGPVAFPAGSPQRKRLAVSGILFAGSHYNLRAS